MHPLYAAILGIVEGITEYLPVSSTGHLILTTRVLGLDGEGADSFDIVIQLGAILAVLVHYRRLLAERSVGLFKRDPRSLSLLLAIGISFTPTAVVGLLFRKKIKEIFFHPYPIAIALAVGGLLMIGVEVWRARRGAINEDGSIGAVGLEHVTPRRALAIGIGQCISMMPGASRSMCTIVAGQLTGLSTATAAEFSFLLGLPTLGGATVYEAYKSRAALATIGAANVAIGLVVSFLVAWAVVAVFLAYLKRRGLVPFGIYRVVFGVLILFILLRG